MKWSKLFHSHMQLVYKITVQQQISYILDEGEQRSFVSMHMADACASNYLEQNLHPKK